jgi:ribA/ribD-fused uncharacterized protein
MNQEDKNEPIFFYERSFYCFSNFSAFSLEWKGKWYMTSEHAYQAEKFEEENLKEMIRNSQSAHDAKKLAQANEDKYIKNWNEIRIGVMKEIIKEKVKQHSYVREKLLKTDDKQIIEDSWRDDFWGWGPNKDGQNHLGKLWMEIRKELISNKF